MAMTAAQYARFQSMLAPEDRVPYETYIASLKTTPTPQTSNTQTLTNTQEALNRLGVTPQPEAPARKSSGIAGVDLVLQPDGTYRQQVGDLTVEDWNKQAIAQNKAAAAERAETETKPAAGGITQEQLDAAIKSALATQATALANEQRIAAAQAAAQREADRRATKQKASDRLVALFKGYNLENLGQFINEKIMDDVSEDMLMIEMYERPEYKTRFPGMEALRKAGKAISEGEYIRIENQMQQTARFFDVPKGFYDGPEDFGNLIAKGVSAKEYQDRLQVGQDLARSLNPNIKGALLDLFGVGEGALTAYVLDPEKALGLIQKQAKAAQFVGYARESGFGLQGITSEEALNLAGTAPYANLSEQQLQKSLQQAGQLRREQARLAGIEGEPYQEKEALDAVITGSPDALLASQRRAQREVARFSERGGVTASSLRSNNLI